MSSKRIQTGLVVLGIFLPRLFLADAFFIQDEQPWLDRSQLYVNSLFQGDLVGAARYPLSNHPAIPLMTVVGPVLNWYGQANALNNTYQDWPLDHKREAAVLGRWAWGIATSLVLLGVYATAVHLRFFEKRRWWAGVLVVLVGLEPATLGFTRTISVDVMIGLALLAAFVTAALAREKEHRWLFALAGAWWGLAFIAKSPALIAAPFVLGLAALLPAHQWKTSLRRAGLWVLGAYVAMAVLWPPFLIQPWQRLTDVLARAEFHASGPEQYLWPGFHPPLFIVTLSTFAFVGVVLYIGHRLWDVFAGKQRNITLFDVILAAAIFHGLVLVFLQGDHVRKNIPVLTLLSAVGAIGWLMLAQRFRLRPGVAASLLMAVQLALILPYAPHILTAHNLFFGTPEAQRLLVDVGNGSRLAADYINQLPAKTPIATAMDSLVQPYLDGAHRHNLVGLPASGNLASLPPDVEYLIVPASLPARVSFDPQAKNLLADLESREPVDRLFIRDVLVFTVYRLENSN